MIGRFWTTQGFILFAASLLLACPSPQEGQTMEGSAEAKPVSEAVLLSEVSVPALLLQNGRIKLAAAELAEAGSAVVFFGEVVPSPQGLAQVGALVDGGLASLAVSEGKRVKKGEVLAWLDSPDVGRARADVARAKATLDLVTDRLRRRQELAKEAAISAASLKEAEAAATMAQAELNASLVILRSLGTDVGGSAGRIALRAPISGMVTQSHAVLGAAVAAHQTLFVVTDIEHLMVEARFPETAGTLPEPGAQFVARPRGQEAQPDKSCELVVENTVSGIDRATRSTLVRLRPSAPCDSLRPGAFVELSQTRSAAAPQGELASTATRDAASEKTKAETLLQVPSLAVVDLRNQPSVFVHSGEEGHFRVISVEPVVSRGGFTVLRSSLRPGEKVAVEGVLLLKGEVIKSILGGE